MMFFRSEKIELHFNCNKQIFYSMKFILKSEQVSVKVPKLWKKNYQHLFKSSKLSADLVQRVNFTGVKQFKFDKNQSAEWVITFPPKLKNNIKVFPFYLVYQFIFFILFYCIIYIYIYKMDSLIVFHLLRTQGYSHFLCLYLV